MKKTIKTYLENRKENSSSILECEVIDIILNHEYEGLENFISDILNYGCESGIVSELTYYYQTKEFFINNMDEIFDLYNEIIQECGGVNFDLNFNILSWFAFEEITRILADELELNY